uniref:PNAS-117 n=1 Tax=Salarias fasciatus TaxID=181472 RepID=A0A672FEC4_SALFA
MALRKLWQNYKVLIVMGSSLGLIHWGWYNLKTHPLLQRHRDDAVPEPAIVSYVSPPAAPNSK